MHTVLCRSFKATVSNSFFIHLSLFCLITVCFFNFDAVSLLLVLPLACFWASELVFGYILIPRFFLSLRHSTGCQSKTGLFFKISTFVFNISDGTLPSYLSSCLSVYTPSRTLRSTSDGWKTLSCARWKLKGFCYRSFSVQAPLVWNNLPAHIRHCSSLSQFKTSLKTFLFTSAYSELL